MSDNVIVLTDRDEIEDLIGHEINDDEWLAIKVQIAKSKYMWSEIDQTIGEIINGI